MNAATRFVPVVALALGLFACKSVYYGTMEKLGVHKREILAERVEDGRNAQADAKEQFQDALTTFKQLTGFDGGELEATYERLKADFERSEDRADRVHDRIDAIESVAADLFEEWQDEIDAMQSPNLRGQSEQMLHDTRGRYEGLIAAMKRAESKMDPVLQAFSDHVVFLKHNLNAKAIASLQGELKSVETDISILVRDMEVSIAEADAFIETLAEES